jgi:Fur family ferric uptake transcriptional regulator
MMKQEANGTSALQEKGHFITTQRRLLLDLLYEAQGHIDAKELYRRAIEKDASVSQATVYRSLNLFKELGLIDEMRLGGVQCYYEVKKGTDHQHLICQGCGKIIEIDIPHFQESIENIQEDHCFNVTKVELFLHGYCTDCEKNL